MQFSASGPQFLPLFLYFFSLFRRNGGISASRIPQARRKKKKRYVYTARRLPPPGLRPPARLVMLTGGPCALNVYLNVLDLSDASSKTVLHVTDVRRFYA